MNYSLTMLINKEKVTFLLNNSGKQIELIILNDLSNGDVM